MQEGGAPAPSEEFVTPPKQTQNRKGTMIYHVYNPGKDCGMSPLQKFEHAITVRNRTLGPSKATKVSPYLDVVMTKDNKRFLDLTDDDVNMHRVLQESMCKHGFRRKVARRTLTAMGSASGQCRVLNDAIQVQKLKANLQFAESLEQLRHTERTRKEATALQKEADKTAKAALKAKRANDKNRKMNQLVEKARLKLGITEDDAFKAQHVESLTATMLQAIAFVYHQARLVGNIKNKRTQLKLLLRADADTEDEDEAHADGEAEGDAEVVIEEEGSDNDTSDEECTEREDCTFDSLGVGDIVEVYWKGMKKWYEGEVTDKDNKDGTVEIHYKGDNQKLYHSLDNYRMRLSE